MTRLTHTGRTAAASRARSLSGRLAVAGLSLAIASAAAATTTAEREAERAAEREAEREAWIDAACTRLLEMQEGPPPPRGRNVVEVPADERREWPYEGIYRVGGSIPIGYRVGGTAIAALALCRTLDRATTDDGAPAEVAKDGDAGDRAAETRAAIERARAFVCEAIDDPRLAHDDPPSYDVRGWGFIYALSCLLELDARGLVSEGARAATDAALAHYLVGLQAIEIPDAGGWNYARGRGRDRPAPFMTGPAVRALLRAKAAGHEVDGAVIERALDALERSRDDAGGIAYAGAPGRRGAGLPGSVGRMLATETALLEAGRGSTLRVRAAIDAFFTHWDRLDERRAKSGTHVGPWGVAPYYFFFAHVEAARAIEMLPRGLRSEYRDRLDARLAETRLEDGTWNDRVFPRTANYGTSCVLLALTMPEASAAD